MKLIIISLIILQINITTSDSIDLRSDSSVKTHYNFSYKDSQIETNATKTKDITISENIENQWKGNFHSTLWKFIWIILILLLAFVINQFIKKLFVKNKLSEKFNQAKILKSIIQSSVWLLSMIFILYLLLNYFSSALYVLIFLLFIYLIIAPAGTLKNIAGGFFIYQDKIFKAGDLIRVQNLYGKVKSINLRTTEIITENDTLISLPNQIFLSEPIENLSVITRSKSVTFNIEISSSEEVSKIKNKIFEIISLSIYNSINKPVEVIYKGINESGKYEFQIKAYVFDAQYENAFKSDIQEVIASNFRAGK